MWPRPNINLLASPRETLRHIDPPLIQDTTRRSLSIRIPQYKTANGVSLDAAHRLYQDVLCFQNATWCSDSPLNVILFKPTTEVRPLQRDCSRNSEIRTGVCACFLYHVSPKSGDVCGKCEEKFCYGPNAKNCFHYFHYADLYGTQIILRKLLRKPEFYETV